MDVLHVTLPKKYPVGTKLANSSSTSMALALHYSTAFFQDLTGVIFASSSVVSASFSSALSVNPISLLHIKYYSNFSLNLKSYMFNNKLIVFILCANVFMHSAILLHRSFVWVLLPF